MLEKVRSVHPITNEETWAYPEKAWYDALIGYLYDPTYKRLLKICYRQGDTPDQARETLRSQLGAKTKLERELERGERMELWRQQRERIAGDKRPVGRPPTLMDVPEFRNRMAAAMMKEIARCQLRRMTPECKALLDATKKQVLGA